MKAKRQSNIFRDRAPGQHRVLLRHVADIAVDAGNELAFMRDPPFLDRKNARDHVHQRGFATT
jgi:hypothetical protein